MIEQGKLISIFLKIINNLNYIYIFILNLFEYIYTATKPNVDNVDSEDNLKKIVFYRDSRVYKIYVKLIYMKNQFICSFLRFVKNILRNVLSF